MPDIAERIAAVKAQRATLEQMEALAHALALGLADMSVYDMFSETLAVVDLRLAQVLDVLTDEWEEDG